MSRLVVRELRRLAELEAVQEVAREVWGFEDRQLPSTSDLQAVAHVGGLTAGAFSGTELVAFVHGLPRTNLAEDCQHSHMLAVRPAWRGRGLAVRLKLFQRSWCLDRGIRLVTWTYDPLLVKNARLNLVRLGARAKRYLPNLYGPLGGIYGRLPSDRFEVHWRLDARDVERAARGILAEDRGAEALPRATSRRRPQPRRLAVEIPADFGALLVSDPAAARRARLKLRRVAPQLFASGYEASSLHLRPDFALYVFERR
ncbi:MAG: GNAT family N-acetyltransferase [Thermoanaerobaculia bacterium]